MHAATTPGRLPLRLTDELHEAVPDRLPKPPAHPPAEPIIIKVPPQPREVPEIDRPDESEHDDGIRRAPWPPDMPPPLPPEERLHQTNAGVRVSLPVMAVPDGAGLAQCLGLASRAGESYIKPAG